MATFKRPYPRAITWSCGVILVEEHLVRVVMHGKHVTLRIMFCNLIDCMLEASISGLMYLDSIIVQCRYNAVSPPPPPPPPHPNPPTPTPPVPSITPKNLQYPIICPGGRDMGCICAFKLLFRFCYTHCGILRNINSLWHPTVLPHTRVVRMSLRSRMRVNFLYCILNKQHALPSH